MKAFPQLKKNSKYLIVDARRSRVGPHHQILETTVIIHFKIEIIHIKFLEVQFHAVGFAGDAFPQTIYLSATVLACEINDPSSCEAQGCTACGFGYAATGRKRRSAEHGQVRIYILSRICPGTNRFNNGLKC